MMIVPGSLGRLGAIASAIAQWLPSGLFTTGVNGAWYDPSDFSTLLQDAAGTTPVTAVGQPVGLMLDKSKGLVLGPELVTNGDFSGGATGWSVGTNWTISGGFASHATGADGYLIQSISGKVVVGKTYKITSVFTGTAPILAGGNLTASNTTLVNGSLYVIASGTSLAIYSNASCSIDSISVRELPGNHAFNPSGNSANFPVLSARHNLLTKTEQFDDAVWAKTSATATKDSVTANASVTGRVAETVTFGTSSAAKFYIEIKQGTSAQSRLLVRDETNSVNFIQATAITWTSGAPNIGGIGAGVWGTPVSVGDGWYQITATGTPSVGSALSISVQVFPDSLNGTGSLFVRKADVRVSNDALNQPAYQRVNTATDYDTVGFKPYLSFNGVNQWLQTNSIDFTYGDKMFVSAGVRKLSDAASVAIFFELSANADTSNGAFVAYQYSTTDLYGLNARGTVKPAGLATSSAAYLAPVSNVYSGLIDISASNRTLRLNGTQVVISSASMGTGNYGNHPLYIGARAGSSYWFNGRLYGLVVAGKQASASEIASTEVWLNQKTGAY